MSENQDRLARLTAWAGELADKMTPILDRSAEILSNQKLKDDDVAGAEKVARAVGVVVRSARAVVMLARSGGAKRAPPPQEDEMNERDDSPETLKRLRDDLERRLSRLQSKLESKGLCVEPGRWPTARAEPEQVRPT